MPWRSSDEPARQGRAGRFYPTLGKLCSHGPVEPYGDALCEPWPIFVKRPSRRSLILLATLAAAILLAFGHVPVLSAVSRFLLCAGTVALGLWGLWHLYHAFLWKVGRRLAFSYFLLGVLPIPLLLVVLAMLGYLLSGFFQGHLYRDAVQSVQRELDSAAHGHLEAFLAGSPPRGAAGGDTAFGYYRKGKKLAGDPRLPAAWPAWLEAPAAQARPGDPRAPRFVAVSGGRPTLAAAASRDGSGVVTLYTGDLDGEAQPARGGLDRALPLGRPRPRHHQPAGGRAQGPHPARPQGPAGRRRRPLLQGALAGRAVLGLTPPLVGGDLGLPRRPRHRPAGGRLRGRQPERHAQRRAAPPLLRRRRDRRPRLGHPPARELPAVRRLRRRRADGGVHDRGAVAGGEPPEPRHRGGAAGGLRRPHPRAAARPGGGPPALLQRDGRQPGVPGRHGRPEGVAGEGAGARPQPPEEPAAGRPVGHPRRRASPPCSSRAPRSAAITSTSSASPTRSWR